jgi:hypothetical protein
VNDYEYDGCGDIDCISCYPDSVYEDEYIDGWCNCEFCDGPRVVVYDDEEFFGEEDCN